MIFFRCDRCGARGLGAFDGGQWTPPAGWHERDLEDWQVHACSQEHLELILSEQLEPTPITSHEGASTERMPLGVFPSALLILVERYGLDGQPPRSLEEVARARGLSRIQVRQVEGRALGALNAIPCP